jgi:hypothetical protein
MAVGVVQGVGPEFKPQYQQKKKKKERNWPVVTRESKWQNWHSRRAPSLCSLL